MSGQGVVKRGGRGGLAGAVRKVAEQSREAVAESREFETAREGHWFGLPYDQIEPNPHQVRDTAQLPESEIRALADNIHAQGLHEQLQVLPKTGGVYPLHEGERRWKAIGMLIADGRWPADRLVPVVIRNLSLDTAPERARAKAAQLATSIHKQEFTALEQIRAFVEISGEAEVDRALSAPEIAERYGFPQASVERHLRVGRVLSETECAWIAEKNPGWPLAPLIGLAQWLDADGRVLDAESRAEAVRLFIRKVPTASLVASVLRPLLPVARRGRRPAVQYAAKTTRGGGFTLSLKIPDGLGADRAALEEAERNIEDALARIRERIGNAT